MDLVIADLAHDLAKSPDLVKIFEQVVNGNLAWNLNFLQQFPDFEKKWLEFMQRFGMRAPGEIDIAYTALAGSTSILIANVAVISGDQRNHDHREHFLKLRKESQNAQKDILYSFRFNLDGSIKNPPDSKVVKRIFRHITLYVNIPSI